MMGTLHTERKKGKLEIQKLPFFYEFSLRTTQTGQECFLFEALP